MYNTTPTKTPAARMVLRLMDEDYPYEQAVKIALKEHNNLSRANLEIELSHYI